MLHTKLVLLRDTPIWQKLANSYNAVKFLGLNYLITHRTKATAQLHGYKRKSGRLKAVTSNNHSLIVYGSIHCQYYSHYCRPISFQAFAFLLKASPLALNTASFTIRLIS